MNEAIPELDTFDLPSGQSELVDLVHRVEGRKRRVVVAQDGVTIAAIVPADDLRTLERVDLEQRDALAVLEAMRAPFNGVPQDELERETANAVKAARAVMADTDGSS